MVSNGNLPKDHLWFDKAAYDEAERRHYEQISRGFSSCAAAQTLPVHGGSSVASEIAKARQHIQKSLKASTAGPGGDIMEKVNGMEKENIELRQICTDLSGMMKKLETRLAALELRMNVLTPTSASAQAEVSAKPDVAEDDDDDVDLFGSDDEEESAEAQKLKEERLAAYAAKKAKKPVLIAKSSVLLDVKPWDDETDMNELEKQVRTVEMDGLLWGAGKLVPLAYGIKKLSIVCTVEDDLVSIEELTEKIESFEDYVQSVDIAAFNKI